jgi:hypothetical protein
VSPKTPVQIGGVMRQRHYRARVWLNENEYKQFIRNVEKAGLSKETYLRQLIKGYKPKELPPIEYHELIQQLILINDNIRQIITRQNETGCSDEKQFAVQYNNFERVMLKIQRCIESSD